LNFLRTFSPLKEKIPFHPFSNSKDARSVVVLLSYGREKRVFFLFTLLLKRLAPLKKKGERSKTEKGK
jgi:hypothetical protein